MLTAGHDLPLQLVPDQVQHPEDGIVQEDQEQNEEEVPNKVEDCQEVKNLLPPGHENGAWVGKDWSGGCSPILSPSRAQTLKGSLSCP